MTLLMDGLHLNSLGRMIHMLRVCVGPGALSEGGAVTDLALEGDRSNETLTEWVDPCYACQALMNLGGAPPTPMARNVPDFMQFFGKIGKFVCWRSPGRLEPPTIGNPGSAPAWGPHNSIQSYILRFTKILKQRKSPIQCNTTCINW